jgi:hypothetical protein
MKAAVSILFLLMTLSLGRATSKVLKPNNNEVKNIIVLHINTKWNKHNSLNIKELKNCSVIYSWLGDQPPSIRRAIQKVPCIIIYKNNVRKYIRSADLSFKLNLKAEDIQKLVNQLNNEKN